jgi:protein-S-isoprenylcysteine O-methyltransferase Ste14
MKKWTHWLTLPPVVLVACAASMLGMHRLSAEQWQWHLPAMLGAAVLLLASIAIMFSACLHFFRAGTTLHPENPQQVNALLVSGIFRFSRNPIYLGQLLLLAAWAVLLGGVGVWLWWLLFFVYLHKVQVPREEAFLSTRFGADYAAFCQRVRRWL